LICDLIKNTDCGRYNVAHGTGLGVPVGPDAVQCVSVHGVVHEDFWNHVEDIVHKVLIHTATGCLQWKHIPLQRKKTKYFTSGTGKHAYNEFMLLVK
jgi:hypothetical protein